ncbi:hypothetical protein [Streptomyces flaveolus]|uniref:hypothetical protein n=1 Tax=Streptomyces flaveolus TaxID=67297 RepID=UPI0033C45D0F
MPRDEHSPASAHPDPPSTPEPAAGKPALLSVRTTLILFIAIAAGTGIGVLTFFAEKSVPKAIIAGVFAAAGCMAGLHSLIE